MIDPLAQIAVGARLAADVTVGAFTVIGPRVELGPGCSIGPHAVITGATRIGARNKIFQFASIGDAPQDKKYAHEITRLEIGDRNTIREFSTMHRGTKQDKSLTRIGSDIGDDNVFREFTSVNRGTAQGGGVTRVGSDNLFMAYTHVAHDCVVGDHCVLANYATLGGHVHLGDWVIMGGYAGIHQFTKVGPHAFLANNTAVTRDVPPYVMAVGAPSVPHSVNSEGLKRRGFNAAQIRNIKNAFRILYRSDLLLADAVAKLKDLVPDQPELALLVDFIGESTRSLIR